MKTTTLLAITAALLLSSSILSTTTFLANAQIFPQPPSPIPPSPIPEEQQQAIEQLQQEFAVFEQQLSQMSPEQQQAAIFNMQQTIMQGLLQTPLGLIPQAIQMFYLAMSPQLAQTALFPVVDQLLLQLQQSVQQQRQEQPPGSPLQPQPPAGTIFPPSNNMTSSIVPPSTNTSISNNITTMPTTGGEGVLVVPPPMEGCAADTVLLCMTDRIIYMEVSWSTSFTNQAIQEHKDREYMPPSTQEQLWDKCTTQATSSNIDPYSYCTGLFQNCARYGFTVEECYAFFFISAGVSIPNDIVTSINQKGEIKGVQEEQAAAEIDRIYRSQMCPTPEGTWGDHC